MNDCSRLVYITCLIISTRYQATVDGQQSSSVIIKSSSHSYPVTLESSQQSPVGVSLSTQQSSSMTPFNEMETSVNSLQTSFMTSASGIQTSSLPSLSGMQTSLITSVSGISTHEVHITTTQRVTERNTQNKDNDSGPIIGVSIFAVFGWGLALVFIAHFFIKRKQKMSKRKNNAQTTYEDLLHRADVSTYNSSIHTTTNPDVYDAVNSPSVYVNSSFN